MSPARRNVRRRDWPRGLYEPRPGYYCWRSKLTGKTYALGAITLPVAKAEANAANLHEAEQAPTLVQRLEGGSHTVAELVAQMPALDNPNTAKSARSLDRQILAELGAVPCQLLTVAKCADLIESITASGRARTAEALRSRLVNICRRGMRLGWLETNPAEVTDTPRVRVQRGRLTLETFRAIHTQAGPWLQRAMMFGLVLGADRLSISQLKRADVADGWLTYRRQKTGAVIAVPLALRMEAVGVSLADLVSARQPVISPFLLCHPVTQGQATAGDPIHPDTISSAFTEARKAAGIPDAGAPTFHELRSLCKREYNRQGGVDTKALLGHAGERVSDLYADPRGVEPIRVKVG